MRVLFLIKSLKTPSSRIRVLDLVSELRNYGIEAETEIIPVSFLQKRKTFWKARSFQKVVLQKRLLNMLELFELRRNSKFLVFDFDDAIYYKNSSPSTDMEDYHSPTRMRKFSRTIESADLVIAANRVLASKVKQITPAKSVQIIPSSVDLDNILRKENYELNKTPVIGWIGTKSTLRYLELVSPALRELRETHDFVLRIISDAKPDIPGVNVDFMPWSLELQNLELRNFDIGLMPLSKDPFSEGKSAYKLLQYLAAGLPAVCSPVGMNAEITEDGRACLQARDSNEFKTSIKRLLEDLGMRRMLGNGGVQLVRERFDKKIIARKLAEMLNSV